MVKPVLSLYAGKRVTEASFKKSSVPWPSRLRLTPGAWRGHSLVSSPSVPLGEPPDSYRLRPTNRRVETWPRASGPRRFTPQVSRLCRADVWQTLVSERVLKTPCQAAVSRAILRAIMLEAAI